MKKYLTNRIHAKSCEKQFLSLSVQIIKLNPTLISIFPTVIGSTLFQIKYSLRQVFLQTTQHTG